MKNIPQLTFMNNNSELYFSNSFFLLPGWKKMGKISCCLCWVEMHHSFHCKYVCLRGAMWAGRLSWFSDTQRQRCEDGEGPWVGIYLALQRDFIRYHRMCCRITRFLSFLFFFYFRANITFPLHFLLVAVCRSKCCLCGLVCVVVVGGAWWQL